VRSSPTLSSDGSVVYVGSDDYSLYAINTNDGSKRWAFQTEGDVRTSPTLSSDGSVVYVGSNDNSLYAISTVGASSFSPSHTPNNTRDNPDWFLLLGTTVPIILIVLIGIVMLVRSVRRRNTQTTDVEGALETDSLVEQVGRSGGSGEDGDTDGGLNLMSCWSTIEMTPITINVDASSLLASAEVREDGKADVNGEDDGGRIVGAPKLRTST
jgi:hypothetical protein